MFLIWQIQNFCVTLKLLRSSLFVVRYRIDGQFCPAANIPLQRDTNTLHEILREKSYEEKVRTVIGERNSENSKVYVGNSVVIARFLKPKHAEYRVLQKLEQLSQNFLLLYSYLSPCSTCTDINDNNNILKQIDMYIHKWTDSAVVFTKVYDKSNSETQSAVDVSTHTPIDRGELAESLLELAWSLGSLRNIFRCDKTSNSELESQLLYRWQLF